LVIRYGDAVALPYLTWQVTANGYSGALVIGSVDSSGNLVSATFFGSTAVGFWSSYENKLTLVRVITAGTPNTWQTYVGYYFDGQWGEPTLVGYFDAFSGTGATSTLNRLGWSAIPSGPSTTPVSATAFTSGTWTATSNGYIGSNVELIVTFSGGAITGSLLGTTIQSGFYNQASQSVTFILATPGSPTTQQLYFGYLQQYIEDGYEYQELDGYFVALAGTGAVADITEYGWQAYIYI